MKQFRSKCRTMERNCSLPSFRTREMRIFTLKADAATTTTTRKTQLLIKEATYPKEIQPRHRPSTTKSPECVRIRLGVRTICRRPLAFSGTPLDGDRIKRQRPHKEIKQCYNRKRGQMWRRAVPSDRIETCCVASLERNILRKNGITPRTNEIPPI